MQKSEFSCSISKITDSEMDQYVSKANLDQLKSIFPDFVDLESNKDLIGLVMNAAVANRVNKNGDAITKKDALNIADNFRNKYVNVEHKQNKIIGCIVNVGFSSFGSNELLTKEQIQNEDFNDPFNISLAVVIWKSILTDESVDFIEAADESSEEFGKVSASWELFFSDYNIAIGSTKNLNSAKIITDDTEKEKYSQYLKINKGSGKKGKDFVYRVLSEEFLIPAGIGLVQFPAAEVNGILKIKANDQNKPNEEKDMKNNNAKNMVKANCPNCGDPMQMPDNMDMEDELNCASCNKKSKAGKWKMVKSNDLDETLNNFQLAIEKSVKTLEEMNKKQENISTSAKTDVIENNQQNSRKINMKIKFDKIEDLTEEVLQKAEASAVITSLRDFLTESIQKANEQFVKEKEAKENELSQANEKTKQVEKDLQEFKENFKAVSDELQALKDKALAKEKEEKFNNRMEAFQSEYEINDETSKILASELKDITDEAFESYKQKMSVLLPKKQKKSEASAQEVKKEEAKEAKKEEKALASEVAVEEAVKTAEKETEKLPNTTQTEKPSLLKRCEAAFALENVLVPSGKRKMV